uniref:Uncharacterized protein n=1 Tax=Magallana gigas TaxID=29159 RepID=K1PHL8_MAGGI
MVGSLVSGRSNLTEHSRPFEVESQNQTETGKTPDLPGKRENEHKANSILEWKLDGRTVPPGTNAIVGSLVSGRSNLTEHSRPFEVESQNQTETGKTPDESECSNTEFQTDFNTVAPLVKIYEKKEKEHMANSVLEWKLDGRTVPPGKVNSCMSGEIPLQLSFVGTTSMYKPVSPVLYPYCRPEHPKGIG